MDTSSTTTGWTETATTAPFASAIAGSGGDVVDIFVRQLDGCTYVYGGLNCTCAVHAMWMFRASQGRVNVTACSVRRETGDKSGGTHLGQMEPISRAHGITGGVVYRPIAATTLVDLLETGRYGAHVQGSYSAFAGTQYDCFPGFRGNHDWYVSGPSTGSTWRVGDPGADGRRAGIPKGYQDIPIALMLRAAALLDVGGRTLGTGKVYAYITPPDPAKPSDHYGALTTRGTPLWNDSTQRWVYNGTNNIPKGTKLELRGKQFPKGGTATYPVTCGSYACNYPGYYVPVANVKLGGKVT